MGKKEEIPSDPRACPPELKAIIESCWETLPTKRPTAIQVVERLKPLVTTEKSEEKQDRQQEELEALKKRWGKWN